MDLGFLDKSSNVTPLLVRLYDSHKLYSLAKDQKPEARVELTSAVAELLDMQLSVRESELVADVLIELIRQAEKDLRQAMAEKLAAVDNAPLRLILQIANDEIDVARYVLRESPVLGDQDLAYIIKSKSAEYWKEIATRKSLSEEVMNALVDTKDLDTALNLVENKNITLSEHSLTVLSDMAQGSEVLAMPLLRRDEVTDDLAVKIYQFVGEELKSFIVENYTVDSELLSETVDDIIFELTETAEENEFIPTPAMLKSADRFKEKGLLTSQLMLGTLRRGQIQSFVAQFSRFTGLSPETIEGILTQPNGQGLAVTCKAYDIGKADFVSIYLLTNRTRNRGEMVDVNDMTKATNYFNRIKKEVALGIMENSSDITGE